MDASIHKSYLGTAYAIKAFVDPRATQGSSLGSALYGVSGMLPRFWSRTPEGYSGPGTIAPMLAGDSSDDENYSDSGDEGTHWEHPPVSVVVGSEAGIDLSSPPSSASYIPLTGGPFSALIQSMWPQDILAKIQQTEDSGVHPLCEYDEFGFKIDPEEHGNKNNSDISSFATVEDPSLRLKWTAYIESLQHHGVGDLTWNQVDAQLEKTGKLRDLVYAGIPHSMRVYLWPRLSGGLMKKRGSEISYKRIVKKSDSQDDSLIASQIEKDLCRTMPSNACYTLNDSIGIPKLKRILRAIAWLYPDIGYCQGMGMIVGSLLLFVDEENAFWIMVAMIEDLLPSSYFSHTLLGVQVDQRVLRQLIANYLPTLDEAMKDHDIELSLITLHWFLTAMASVLPLKVLLRVWDIFFFEGSIVLFKLTLGMLKMKEKVISRMENSAQIFNLLSDLPGEITDVEELLQHANKASASLTPVIINAHREKHFAFLLATEASLQGEKKSVQNNNNYENRFASLEIVRRTRLPVRKSWSHLFFDLGYSILEAPFCGLVSGRRSALAVKAKNVRQTEIISDLRESVVQIARHFNFTGTKADLLPDYSIGSHVKDYENYVNVARSKHRRAKALIDFERHEDDELGFRKNDLITIISQKDEHCWIGELNGLRGWFPAKFVELLDERSKEYSAAGDDTVTEAITDLVRGRLCRSVEAIFEHGLKQGMGVACHPWLFIQEASKNEVKKDFKSVYSRLVLCKTYKLDDDGKVLSPEELLYRAVQEIDATHDAVKANMDVKMRSLIAYGLNEQALHLWFEALCSSEEATRKWYHAHSFIRSPGWIQIKCELRALAQFSFDLSINTEISDVQATASNMKEDVQDMLVKHHLFSWDL